MDCYSEHFFSPLTWEWMWGIDLGEGPHRSFTNESGHMVSCKCFVQGKENGIRCIPPPPTPSLIHHQSHRARMGRLKTLLEGGRQWTINSPVPFMHLMQRDRNDRPFHGLIYAVRRFEEWLCQNRGKPHHLGCPLLSALSWTNLPCTLSSLFIVIAYYYFCKCQNFHFFKSFEYLQNLSFQILLKLNRCRQGRDNNGKPYFPRRATALSLALPHLRFLKGNVIILLINRKSDRPICQE